MDAAAHAIADPVRRGILDALSTQARSAGELAELFPITRPAVSRHLRVLRESGLVKDHMDGRHRLYAINVTPLAPLVVWIGSLGPAAKDWNHKLDALETEVHRAGRDRRRSRPPATHQEDSA